MTIQELAAILSSALTANDQIPVWDAEAGSGEEPTKKVTLQNLAEAIAAIGSLVTGVKGNAEGNYRTGNVNLTPANLGALPATAALKVNFLSATVTVSAYAYALGGYNGSIAASNMTGYDASLSDRTLAYIPISCYYASNAAVNGAASMLEGANGAQTVLVNGSNSGDYFVRVAQLYA